MDDVAEDAKFYTIKCHHCGEQATLTPLNWITAPFGFIFLIGEKDGYVGITCPDEGCHHTTLKRANPDELRLLRETIFEEAECGPGFVKPLFRYRSFPFNFGYPEELRQHRIGFHEKGFGEDPPMMEKEEASIVLTLDDSIDPSGFYSPYSYGDLAMGPAMYLPLFSREGVEEILKFENATQRKVFPRYVPYDRAMETMDRFCYRHFMKEVWIEETRNEDPGMQLLEERQLHHPSKEADRNHEFFEILTTPAEQTRKRYESLRFRPEDPEDEATSADSMEHEVAANYNKGHGKEFLGNSYQDFIREYMAISGKVDFTARAVEALRKKYIKQLHQQMQIEILATKQYAFFEEPPTWTIVFAGKRIPNLTGKGFKYIHYLVSNMRKQFSVFELAKLTADLDIGPAPRGGRIEDEEDKKVTAKKKDSQRIADEQFLEKLQTRLYFLDEQIDSVKQATDPYSNKEDAESERDSILAEIREIKSRLRYPKGEETEPKRLKDRITKRIERAVNELMKNNEKAGKHFEAALRPINSLQQRYNPIEDIRWHLE